MAEGNRLIMNIACVLVLVFSTHKTATAQKKTSNIKNYICMNAIQTQSQMDLKGFELKIPENWCTYIGFHDILSYSPKSLLNLSKNHYKNSLYVAAYDNDSYKSKDIEEALSKHYVLLNTDLEFAPVYNADVHKSYGKYYILKSISIQKGEKFINLDVLFNYKNQDYILYYSVLEKDFETYVNDVIQIIESFKILE